MHWIRSVALLAVLLLLTPTCLQGADFKPLDLPDAPTTMTISEDGRHLIVGFEKQNRIAVIETISKRVVKNIKCKTPRHLLSRGKQLFVANYGHGTVGIISLKTLKQDGEIALKNKDVFFLSAAHGNYFKGQILASCGKPLRREYFLVNVATKASKMARKSTWNSAATVNHTGDSVVFHGTCKDSVFTDYKAIRYSDLSKEGVSLTNGEQSKLPLINQWQKGAFWVGGNSVHAGTLTPWKISGKNSKTLYAIPDVLSKTYYAIGRKTVSLHQLNMHRNKVREWNIALPRELTSGPPWRGCASLGRDCYFNNLGVRIGDRICLFLFSDSGKKIFSCDLKVGQGKEIRQPAFVLGPKAFRSLPLSGPGTTICMTEDGKFLLVGHPSSDLITVWDVINGKTVKSIKSMKPTVIISRGDKAYVAHAGSGKITVLSQKTWKPENEILVGSKRISFLSAAKGKFFKNKIVVSCGDRNQEYYEVDVTTDQSRLLRRQENLQHLAIVSYTGKYVMLQKRSSYYTPKIGTYVDFCSKDVPRFGEVYSLDGVKFPEQFSEGSYWFGRSSVYAGMPLVAKRDLDDEGICVPDLMRKVYYEVTKDGISALSLDTSRRKLKAYPTTAPPSLIEDARLEMFDPPPTSFNVAATHGKFTYIFVLEKDWNVYGAKVQAVKLPAEQPAAKFTDQRFQAIKFENPATSLALTESGKYLIVCHADADRISIWDVDKRKPVKTIRCKNPAFALCRGNAVYVSNYGHGTITVVSTKNWKPLDEIKTGNSKVSYLSAPGGSHFKGKIIATDRSTDYSKTFVVDVESDKSKPLRTDTYVSVTTVSYDGSKLIQQGMFSHSPSGTVTGYDCSPFMNGKPTRSFRGEHSNTPYLVQFRKGHFWFGDNRLYVGFPPSKFGSSMGKYVVPDLQRDSFFIVDDESISARDLDLRRKKTHEWKITLPKALQKPPRQTTGKYSNVGATLGDHVHIFLFDSKNGAVFTCRLPTSAKSTTSGSEGDRVPGEMPKLIAEGKPLRFRIFGEKKKGSYKMIRGPKGIRISDDGEIFWTPTKTDVGKVSLKIRSEIGDEIRFHRYQMQIVSAAMAAKADSAETGFDGIGRYALFDRQFSVDPGFMGKHVLLNADGKLRLLDSDGLTTAKTHKLKKSYIRILQRKDTFVCLASDSLDVLAAKDFKVIRSVEIPGRRALDLALHPGMPVAYVSIKSNEGAGGNKVLTNQIIGISEKTGKISRFSKAYGQHLAISPSGDRLFALLNETFYSGGYRSADVLISYDVFDKTIILKRANQNSVANGRGLCVSPNGKYVSVVSGGGVRAGPAKLTGYVVGTFATENVEKLVTSYRTDAHPKAVAHHPILNLVAAGNDTTVRTFEQGSGAEIADKVAMPNDVKEVHRLMFSPGGKNLLVLYTCKDNFRLLRSLPLSLTDKEKALVAKGYTRPKVVVRKAPDQDITTTGKGKYDPKKSIKVHIKASEKDLDAIKAISKTAMSTKEIAAAYMNAVVIIKHSKGSGTGFFISKKGHVLTCAHVIPQDGIVQVAYQVQGRFIRTKSKLLAIDRSRDLALLKIAPMGKIVSVRLPKTASVATGAKTSLIGHPGLGDKILDYTMTSGIVSSPKRIIDGLRYIQTNASINPGMSGGPMFDSFGNVIGVVVLKAKIEGVGMAVPHKSIIDFIKAAAK